MIDPVLLSVIRKITPNVVASSIVNVQPMFDIWLAGSGGKSRLFEYRAVSNNYYRNFVRLNNRRKTQSSKEFRQANYPESSVDFVTDFGPWFEWMNTNIGSYRYFLVGYSCFFVDTNDKTLYDITWSKTA